MTSNNSGFSIIPNSIFDNDDVKDFALLVLIILHCYKDNKNQVNMSLNEIARTTGLNKKTVVKYIKKLIKLGYITKETRVTSEKVFSSNIYTIIK